MSASKPPLTLLSLETRLTPALFGLGWVNPQGLTVSFAPDGTDVGGTPSVLHADLNADLPTVDWPTEIRRAVQTWSAAANLNARLVPDDGAAFGTPDPVGGAVGRGDIRVAARPLSGNVLAVANPPDATSGWAGEIVVNSDARFTPGGADGGYDLYTVVLQEVGHALGIGDSPDPSSVLFGQYRGLRTELAAADVQAVQGLYGPRPMDAFEGSGGNNTASRATSLGYVTSATSGGRRFARADLGAGDVDVFRFTTPSGTRTTTVQLLAGEFSQLAGRLTLRTQGGTVVATGVGTPGQTVTLTAGLTPSTTYTLTVDAADARFAVGGYQLAVGSVSADRLPAANPDGMVDFNLRDSSGSSSGSSDGSGGLVVHDLGTAPAVGDRWDVAGTFVPAAAAGQEVFKLKTDDASRKVLLAAVWGVGGGAAPRVTVLNKDGRPMPAQVLTDDGFNHVVQVGGVKKGDDYYLRVEPAAGAAGRVGLGVNFRSEAVALTRFASGTLTALADSAVRGLTVDRSQLFRFELTGQSLTGQQEAFAALTVRNAAGQVVARVEAGGGERNLIDVFLDAGAYTVTLTGQTTDGSPLGRMQVTARIGGLTNPIGPVLLDADPYSGGTVPPTSPPPTSPPPISPPPISPPPIDYGYHWDVYAPSPEDFFWW